jgi:hypothetical protein
MIAMSFKSMIQSVATAAALLSLAACGGSGSSTSSTGQLKLGLTDGPVEKADRVVVQFTGIEMKPAGGAPMDPVLFDSESCDEFASTGACSIDLLALTGDERKVVFNKRLEAGNYDWVRLLVNAELDVMDSYIDLGNGWMCSLYIPSSAQSGLKIVSGITVAANGVSDYTLDFDVRKSITQPPGLAAPMDSLEMCAANYLMKPAIRIVDTTQVGTIRGTVPEVLLSDAGCVQDETTMQYQNVAAYVFENFDGAAIADDIDGDASYRDPVTTASVEFDADPAVNGYVYEAGFLLSPEDYLVALTCTSDLDFMDIDEFDPTVEEPQGFSFFAEQTVTTIVDEIADGSF